MKAIEKLQKYFIRKIPALRELDYWQQLDSLNMISLQRRLKRYRIIYIWKILEHQVPNCGILKGLVTPRDYEFFLSKNHVIEKILKFFFANSFSLVILKNPHSNLQNFTFSECKNDLAGLLHHNQSQLLPSQLLQHVGQEPHLHEPQHIVLLLHIHQPLSSFL